MNVCTNIPTYESCLNKSGVFTSYKCANNICGSAI